MRALVVAALFGLAAGGCFANEDIPPPRVASVVPDHAPVGALVAISGSNFCQRPDTGNEDPTCDIAGTVHFGTVPGTPSSWSDTVIMVEVPAVGPGRADVSVTAAGRTSNSVAFTAD